MFIAISTSIKLYLNLAALITQEVSLSKDFYSLAIDIYRVLNLSESDRSEKPVAFLSECYSTYKQLVEASSLMKTKFKKDELIKIDHNLGSDTSSFNSFNSNESKNILIREENDL